MMEKMNLKRLGLRLAAATMALSLTAAVGCGGDKKGGDDGYKASETKLPIVEKEITLKWWYPIAPEGGITSWAESEVFKELKKRTNINLEFEIPVGDAAQQYTLMMSSGTMPDIITHQWFGFAGGPDAAVEDKAYIDLTDYYEKGELPNYRKMVEEAKAESYLRSNAGRITWFSSVRTPGIDRQPPYVGPVVRKDWLDKLGLETPETIDDWYTMLKAFKTQLKVEKPLSIQPNGYDWNYSFMNSYGVTDGFTVENDKVVYGPADERMLAFVTEMNKWYKEGLLIIEPQDEKNYYNDSTAAWNHGFYLLEEWKGKASDPKYNAVGVPYPVLKSGDEIKVTYYDDKVSTFGQGTFITTENKYPLETAKMFDYLYSDDGVLLTNYGVEGLTYEKDSSGKPAFNDYMLKNPDGKSFLQMIKNDTFSRFVNDWHIELQGFSEKEVDALTVQWAKVKDTNNLPRLDYFGTASQITEYNRLAAQIPLYARGKITAFITGEEPLSNWNAYTEQLKAMGVGDMTRITQEKYDSFKKNEK